MNDTINITNSTVVFPNGDELPGLGVRVIGHYQAVNDNTVRFAAAGDLSPTVKHFEMVPLRWQPDAEGKTPADLGDDVVLLIQRVHCSMAALAISDFEVSSYDNVVAVTLNNPSHKAVTLSSGEVRVDVLAIATGNDWRVPPAPTPYTPAC